MTTQPVPFIPGFIVRELRLDENPDRRFLATRVEDLTPYQVAYGCRKDVTAATVAELECLCTAELVHAAMVDRAEQAAINARRIADMRADARM